MVIVDWVKECRSFTQYGFRINPDSHQKRAKLQTIYLILIKRP